MQGDSEATAAINTSRSAYIPNAPESLLDGWAAVYLTWARAGDRLCIRRPTSYVIPNVPEAPLPVPLACSSLTQQNHLSPTSASTQEKDDQ
jgi:hypothetical protein